MMKDDTTNVHTREVHSDCGSIPPVTKQQATDTTSTGILSHWPAEPHALVPEPQEERWLLVYDVVLCLIPFALINKVVLCIVASVIDKNHKGSTVDEVSNLTLYLIRFNHQLTTLFTVVFVLIVTTVVRRLALYKAQEGATIAKLEQLQASISLPGTLRAAWSLRSFKSRTSVVLLLIWTFYYLGSQATTSEYEYRLSSASHKLPMVYFNVKKPSMFYSSYSTVKVTELALSNINAIYNTFTMVLSNGNIPTASDLNGAVLLPLLRADGTPRFGQPRLQRGLHDYYDVSDPSKVIYTSYVGMPIFTLLPGEYGIWIINGMQGNYNLNASYFNASCEVMGIQNASSFPRNTDPQTQISINTTML